MAEIQLSQVEADALVKMPKLRVDEQDVNYPVAGEKISIPLISEDKREKFLLDVSRGRIDLKRRPTKLGRGKF